jgi:translation elongation factor EF-Tu-like GTPase
VKITDDDLLELVEEMMELLKDAGNPENAALVLLACHAMNYENNANRDVPMQEYLDLYEEQFKGFFKGFASCEKN